MSIFAADTLRRPLNYNAEDRVKVNILTGLNIIFIYCNYLIRLIGKPFFLTLRFYRTDNNSNYQKDSSDDMHTF